MILRKLDEIESGISSVNSNTSSIADNTNWLEDKLSNIGNVVGFINSNLD